MFATVQHSVMYTNLNTRLLDYQACWDRKCLYYMLQEWYINLHLYAPDGGVLTMLQGHDYSIYCMRWFPGEGSPFASEAFVTNSRAEAMKETGKPTGKPSHNLAANRTIIYIFMHK